MKTTIYWQGEPIVVEHNDHSIVDVRDLQGNFVSIDSNKHNLVMERVNSNE